jgi:BirA family biotin operon repressor/biotin-[acetyl-CoA-carboxylase] ligase
MDFIKSARRAENFEYVAETGSTNADLVAKAAGLQGFSVLVAGAQTAGRGRLGRVWVSPPEKSLAISVLVRPHGWSMENFGWLPLIAGLAMRRAVASVLPTRSVILKWPNDVQVDGKKISGILSELLPDASGVVIGAGINLTLTREELPIEAATSLSLEGSEISPDDFLDSYLAELQGVIASPNEVANLVRAECATIGQSVKAIFPNGTEVFGDAVGIDDSGRLLISFAGEPQLLAVSAADIQHLRHN